MSSRAEERYAMTPHTKQAQAATASYASRWGNEKDLRFYETITNKSCGTKYSDLTKCSVFIFYIKDILISPDGKESEEIAMQRGWFYA